MGRLLQVTALSGSHLSLPDRAFAFVSASIGFHRSVGYVTERPLPTEGHKPLTRIRDGPVLPRLGHTNVYTCTSFGRLHPVNVGCWDERFRVVTFVTLS